MPIMASSDRKLFAVGGGVLLLLIVLAAIFTPDQDAQPGYATTYSSDSSGTKAAYLLLKESGYRVDRWENSPIELTDAKDTTLIITDPIGMPTLEERKRLKQFVAQGGRIVGSGVFVGTFLPVDKSAPEQILPDFPINVKASIPSEFAKAAPEIKISPSYSWQDRNAATPLYGDEKVTLVASYRYGAGDVIWLASADPFSNRELKESGNLAFLLTAVGDKKSTHVLFDEYFHGHRRSLVATMSHTQVKWLVVQFAVVAFFALLTFSRRSGPIRSLAAESRLSPLEFVDTLGGLYERADAAMVAVDVNYQRFRYWLTRRAGISPKATIEELEQVVRDRWNLRDPQFGAVLHACEEARYNYETSPRQALHLVQALQDYAGKLKLYPVTKQARKQEKP
jgi:Domain of unknown function (DUF4350)